MNNSVPVSVIVPAYNSGKFIAETIDSILSQTQVPNQIIIVDDGSTDNTEQVVKSFTDFRIQYIKQKNAGVSSARNTGLDAATNEFVTFLDADDRWRRPFVSRMYKMLLNDPDAVCAFSNFVRFEQANGIILAKSQFEYYTELNSFKGSKNACLYKHHAFNHLVGCGEIPAYTQVMMFRRSLIPSLRFNTNLKICEDAHFALQAFMQGNVWFTEEILAEVRRHDNNVTRDISEMAVHKLNALKALAIHVRDDHSIAYYDRLVKAHIDAALYRVKAGVRYYRDGLRVPGSTTRKIKGFIRLLLSVL